MSRIELKLNDQRRWIFECLASDGTPIAVSKTHYESRREAVNAVKTLVKIVEGAQVFAPSEPQKPVEKAGDTPVRQPSKPPAEKAKAPSPQKEEAPTKDQSDSSPDTEATTNEGDADSSSEASEDKESKDEGK